MLIARCNIVWDIVSASDTCFCCVVSAIDVCLFVVSASNMCFAEKTVYTQEVLAVVLQHLMDLQMLPTLLMRTVIQSLAMYPKLIGFIMNIMQRLIHKQVIIASKY